MTRILLAGSGLFGFLAVALGAFGAHGLRARFESLPDAAKRLEWWQTASSYQATHALALAVAAFLAQTSPALAQAAGGCFALGIVLFSGSLYAMALTGLRPLGAVTPLGGLCFLAGWALILVGALRMK
jgi:uncharacterized membrane protein YgdD (TMEM256/DUF423 family)